MREFVPCARSLTAALAILLCCSTPYVVGAQLAPQLDLGGTVDVGSETERYLRALQLTDSGFIRPWMIQPFVGMAERALMPPSRHPWEARFTPTARRSVIRWLRPSAAAILNTAFPYQLNVGPVWAGRGATALLQGGVAADWGRLHVQVAPLAFVAQNAAFPVAPNGYTGLERLRDPRFPLNIDLPQRFGETAYARLDAGSSSLFIDLGPASAGVSSAAQLWGPAREFPLLLGPAAGGFPHAFVGTTQPIDVRIARVEARFIAGTLAQSALSPAAPDRSDRIASAAVVGLLPKGLDGLELGFARFFESTERLTLTRLLRPISLRGLGALGDAAGDVNVPNENQTASAFFRWHLPRAALEVYGEWYREDFPGDVRKLVLKPDDWSAFMVGFQHALLASPARRRIVRLEVVNGELSHQERGQRGFAIPLPIYFHAEVVQGHTHRGLLLGSPEAYGGAGWRIGLDDYTDRGRQTVALERALRFDWLRGLPTPVEGVHPDVIYALRFERMRFAGSRDVTVIIVPAVNLNRNLDAGSTQLNLQAALRVRGW
jgi:hypothetical protein